MTCRLLEGGGGGGLVQIRGGSLIDLFTVTAAILISIVSNIYYGMPRGQIHINFPPGHPIIAIAVTKVLIRALGRAIHFYLNGALH